MDKAQASGWTSYSLQEGREVCKPRQSVPKPGLTATFLVKEKAELNSCFNGFSVLVEKVKTNKQISGYITQLQGELWREIKQSKEHEKEALFWASVVRKAFLDTGPPGKSLNYFLMLMVILCWWTPRLMEMDTYLYLLQNKTFQSIGL